ncbi:hypothetical protein PINS_up000639 [Pythium insidiosum]|nr:hypothetical protein PINS_up000639 [Pythium insidiosum]
MPISLLVRNLDQSTTADDLRRAFTRKSGDIRDIYIPKEFGSNQPRGFAFIEFADMATARQIKREMDRTKLNGREIAVLFAQQGRKTPGQMREQMDREQQEKRKRRRSRSRSQSRSRSRSPRPRSASDSREDGKSEARGKENSPMQS